MKIKLLLLAALCAVGLAGCTDAKKPGTPETTASSAGRDNTGVNVRDGDSTAKTPFDQKENKDDIATTADVRKQIVGSDMSTDAKNVKIITENGHVTLRGPVKSANEKTQIEKIALQVAGEGKVDNQLEVASGR
jgi:hyperosmotically inducible periplasmic protein